ncbi:hypothetical protein G6L37_03860 [Agrobacterium rubi]|nr:hypothetical protein [Agrobacterium rubi]NTF24485.1 hypothetical protein [Agrobacterium rubi]
MSNSSRLVIVLNGPPRAGKDTAIEILQDVFSEGDVFQFFRPIKEMLHAELGLDVRHDHFEALKDQPLPEFKGMTPRRAYIDKGERLQAEFGHSVLLDIYFQSISSSTAPVLITTCGNDGEACEIASIFGNENVLVVRIHKDGCDFSQDSRSWVSSTHLNLRDVRNIHGRPRDYQSEVAAVASIWVDGRRAEMAYAA